MLSLACAVAVVACTSWILPPSSGIFGALLASLMIVVAYVDQKSFIIPDALTLCSIASGLAYYWWADANFEFSQFEVPLFRGAIASAALWLIRLLYARYRAREGIGLGDVKLAFVAGVWLDWSWLPVCIEIASLGALGVYLCRAVVQSKGFDRSARVPFGLFFGPAIWFSWVVMVSGYNIELL